MPGTHARPNRLPWPPLLYGAALLIGLGMQAVVPITWPPLLPELAIHGAGIGLAGAGLALDVWAAARLYRARTSILPHRPADRLVTDGPFGFTRNPIYLGNTLVLLGIGFILRNPWLIPAALLAAVATDRLAARREERHLAARFGPTFAAYAARVPRWIGPARPLTPPPSAGPDRS